MAKPKDSIQHRAIALIRQFPEWPARTLARRLVEDTGGAITLDAARSRIRQELGQIGNAAQSARKGAGSCPRPSRKPGQTVEMPKSQAESWGPYTFEVSGLVGELSDVHVPYHSEKALGAAVAYLKDKRIAGLVLNGDICDFYAISRFIKNPAKRNFRRELEQIRQFMGWIRQEFPSIPMVMKAGNHEERWKHWLWQHAPEVSDGPEMGLPAWLHLERHDIDLVEDGRPIMVGKLPILHGHEKGAGFAAPVNQARGAFLRLHHTVLEGHGHRTSAHCEPDMFGKECFTWSTGCLAELRPEYSRFAKYNHGFATVLVEPDGEFQVMNLRIVDGKVRSS
jgi:hypothetical protein